MDIMIAISRDVGRTPLGTACTYCLAHNIYPINASWDARQWGAKHRRGLGRVRQGQLLEKEDPWAMWGWDWRGRDWAVS